VIQLLKEAGVDLLADASANASSKPSDAAAPDVDNLDLVNMPAIFDHEGDETSWDETSWQQGLPPGEVGPQLSELELSDSDSSVVSILGVCLHGFDGDAWMSDAEGAHDDIQVVEAAGVNDPGDIPWRTTAWRAGSEDQNSTTVEKGTVAEGNVSGIGCLLLLMKGRLKNDFRTKQGKAPAARRRCQVVPALTIVGEAPDP